MTLAPPPPWSNDNLADAEFAAIARLLADQRGFDLHGYKDSCVRRRIVKRLRDSGASSADAYLQRLHRDPEELDALLASISIHVSRFFRDPETFRALERDILPDLCERVRATGRNRLRLWSIGCAGGEEPYSLAMLVDELQPAGLEIDILGSDLSADVLQVATEARYDAERLREVPGPVRDRYFRAAAGQFRLIDRVRAMVRFQQHDILRDTHLPTADLILCRYLLIYFSRTEQERILTRLAQSLSPFGVLVLGHSEVPGGQAASLYHAEFPRERIFRRHIPPPQAAPGSPRLTDD
ncbi:MAG: protein-glutamate O-methyltransferase CheR [Desulfuromonadales bacterium]|nr:protein-glutamate O-methyltransferase CheR [Desulfuromonadales bacterium]